MTESKLYLQKGVIKINPQEILELVRAGYTKEDINSMIQPDPEPKPDPEPNPEPEPNDLNALKEELSNLKKLIQKRNINNSGKDSPPPLTASEALASLITKNKKE